MPAKQGYSVSKTRNMEKSVASNARPSQTDSGVSAGKGYGNRGSANKDQFSFGKVNKG